MSASWLRRSFQVAALQYVGSPTGGPRLEQALSFWYVVPAITSVPSRPSVRQEPAGQHWLACIIYLRQDTHGGVGDLPRRITPRYGPP